MLHLANGEATADLLRQAGLVGGIASADDILMEGPLPNGLLNPADWEQRAAFLGEYLGIVPEEYMRGAQLRQHLLARALEEDESVLWFEEDVFCQINYLQALSWLADRAAKAHLSYVCPPTERLGRLSGARLAELFEQRRALPIELLQLAARAWPLVAAAEPTGLMGLIEHDDFAAWPLLRTGLRRHLARLPDRSTGLSALERAVLESAAEGATCFDDVFLNATRKAPEYGAGDTQFMRYLHDLAAPPAPLIIINTGNGAARWPDHDWTSWRIMPTALGLAVLRGERDHMEAAQPNRYVGGIHVTRSTTWRWDNAAQRPVAPTRNPGPGSPI